MGHENNTMANGHGTDRNTYYQYDALGRWNWPTCGLAAEFLLGYDAPSVFTGKFGAAARWASVVNRGASRRRARAT